MYTRFNKIKTGNGILMSFPETVKAFVLCLSFIIFISSDCKGIPGDKKKLSGGKEVVLRLEPGPDNPRNSEGDFITLKNGRILFIYSHFTGQSGSDFGNAYLAGRFSDDNGKTWSKEDHKIVEQEGDMNIMSVSPAQAAKRSDCVILCQEKLCFGLHAHDAHINR